MNCPANDVLPVLSCQGDLVDVICKCCNIEYPVICAGSLFRASVADIGGCLKPAACSGHILVAELFAGNTVPAGGIAASVFTEPVYVAVLPVCTVWEHCDGPSSFRAFSGVNFTLDS